MRTHRWGLVAATVLGLVAMHGVGSHGVHGAEADQAAIVHVAGSDHTLAAMVDEVASPEPAHETGLGLTVLCVAVLVGLVMASWLARRAGSSVGRFGRGGRAHSLILTRARDPGPPSLAELSILRC